MSEHDQGQGGEQHPQYWIDQVVQGRCRDPFGFLGRHDIHDGLRVVRTFQPQAERVELIDGGNGATLAEMERIHSDGLFSAVCPNVAETPPLRFRTHGPDGVVEFEDPYQQPPVLEEMDTHLFIEGTHWKLYERLGAQVKNVNGVDGVFFAVWAPNAHRVSVVGSFNNWDGRRHPMRFRVNSGIWELFIPRLEAGAYYKFEIQDAHGNLLPLKCDPFARFCEPPPGNASIVQPPNTYAWGDQAWLEKRQAERDAIHKRPMSIYEVHPGSWKRKPEEGNRQLTYHEMAEELVAYVRAAGFTHVEFLPLAEHPFEPSWGYQPIGLFAPNHRFGDPDGLRHMVDAFHQAGIGVLVDWVPGHFPEDGHGLGRFDGTGLFEHEDPRRGRHPDWDTLIYNYGRREVSNFLIANALFWIEEFHIDGLRVDAVASMLYHDYARENGEWIPNEYGGRENLEAVAFLRELNRQVEERGGGAITIAEESTAWGGVSKPESEGGLGFQFKWNMGWMNDTLEYMKEDPIHRKYHHNKLSFGMLYAFHEHFILPLSHDEVVHGKGSLLSQMAGSDGWQKFANLRAYYTFMFGYPGKKILFMGSEFAQGQEWTHAQSLDWHLPAEIPAHQGIWNLVRDLNHLYVETPALYNKDDDWSGFEWIEPDDSEQSILSFIRHGVDCPEAVVVINFTPVTRHDFRIGVNQHALYREVFNSDWEQYGGSNVHNGGAVHADQIGAHNRPCSLNLSIPPLAGMIFAPETPAASIDADSGPEPVEAAPEPEPEPAPNESVPEPAPEPTTGLFAPKPVLEPAPEPAPDPPPAQVAPEAVSAPAPEPEPAKQPEPSKKKAAAKKKAAPKKKPDVGTLTCLECGQGFKSLSRHLKTHGLDAAGYRAKHNLPDDAPMQVAASKKGKK